MNTSSHPSGPVLLVLEQGRTRTFRLEEKSSWSLGRAAGGQTPDIPLSSKIAGRNHGEFLFIDGFWFYCDHGSLNGTFRNGRKLRPGLGGRAVPVLLEDGDLLRIDCGGPGASDERAVLMRFLACPPEEPSF